MAKKAYSDDLRRRFLSAYEQGEQRRGTPRKLLEGPREQLRIWLMAAPDLTLDQLQDKLRGDCEVKISRAQVARVLKRMGLKLKKSHSTPASEIPKRTLSGESSSSCGSTRSRRKSLSFSTKAV